MRGLWNLTWLEIKIFVREPLGLFGTVLMPVIVFVVLGRILGGRMEGSARLRDFATTDAPVLVAMLVAINAVLSLVTIVAIYRESGILKRLRATPLGPPAILTAHVLVKLVFTSMTLGLLAVAGRRFYPVALDVSWPAFALALLASTTSVLSLGFVIASVVPTARFAQPVGAMVLYPMFGLSGIVPTDSLPAALQLVARANPLTYAVSLLRGIWSGHAWSAHVTDLAVLTVVFAASIALSARVFRWQ